MDWLYRCLVCCVVSVVAMLAQAPCSAAKPKIFNSVAGPFTATVESVERCDPSKYDLTHMWMFIVDRAFYFNRTTHRRVARVVTLLNETIRRGDTKGARWDPVGGWKQNYYVFDTLGDPCPYLDTLLRPFARSAMKLLSPPTEPHCPVQKHWKNAAVFQNLYTVSNAEMKVDSIPILPSAVYGRYLFHAEIRHAKSAAILACAESVIKVEPKAL